MSDTPRTDAERYQKVVALVAEAWREGYTRAELTEAITRASEGK